MSNISRMSTIYVEFLYKSKKQDKNRTKIRVFSTKHMFIIMKN